MTRRLLGRLGAAAFIVAVLTVRPAAAVDAPRWVATLFVQAQNAVGLRWNPVPGASEYKVLRSEKAGADHKEIASTPQPQYFDTTIEAGVTYYYVLRAVAGGEASAPSEERSVAIPGVQKVKALEPPVMDKVALSQRTEFGKVQFQAGVFWKAVPNAIAYNVYRSEVKGKDQQLVGSVSEAKFIDEKVDEGKTYYYSVSALDNQFQETARGPEQELVVKKEVKAGGKAEKVEVNIKPTHLLFKIENKVSLEGGVLPILQPADVVVNEKLGRIYLSNYGTKSLLVFDANTWKYLFAIRRTGPEKAFFVADDKDFQNPQGLGISPDGDIYVVDQPRGEVAIFSADGDPQGTLSSDNAQWAGTPKDLHPNPLPPVPPIIGDVAVDRDGLAYVSDGQNAKVLVFDGRRLVRAFARKKTPKAQNPEPVDIMSPSYIDASADGRISFVDAGQIEVVAFTPEGEFHSRFGKKGNIAGTLFAPTGIIATADGGTIVASGLAPNIQKWDKDLKLEWLLSGDKDNEPIDIGSIRGMYLDAKNRLYIAGANTNTLAVFQLSDQLIKRE